MRKQLTSEQALRAVVEAWESLPGGQWYSPQEVQDWLSSEMKPAIDGARRSLGMRVPKASRAIDGAEMENDQ